MKLRLARISTRVLLPLTTTVVAGLAVHCVLNAAKDVLKKPSRQWLSAKELARQ